MSQLRGLYFLVITPHFQCTDAGFTSRFIYFPRLHFLCSMVKGYGTSAIISDP